MHCRTFKCGLKGQMCHASRQHLWEHGQLHQASAFRLAHHDVQILHGLPSCALHQVVQHCMMFPQSYDAEALIMLSSRIYCHKQSCDIGPVIITFD